MDVTKQINQIIDQYGGGDNSIDNSVGANKALNFAEGASIQKPVMTGTITRLPFTLTFKGEVGSFGADNQFFEIKTDIKDFQNETIFQDGWASAAYTDECPVYDFYDCAIIDYTKDLEPILNTYLPARISDELVPVLKPVFTMRMVEKGTGNIYVDEWLDVVLYNKKKEALPYEGMLLRSKDKFYLGFHARNTRRLGYNVEVTIGEAYTSEYNLTAQQRELLQ